MRPPQPWRRTSLLERSLRHLDALITPSRTSARLHARFAGLVPLEVLPNFAPEPAAVPRAQDRRDPSRRPFFLYAGRLESIKGVEALIEAFRRRRSEDLVIAGEGTLDRRLRRRAAGLDHVHFTGRLSQNQLGTLYRDALAVVMPTLGHEVMPLVALEALAHGTPLIVRRFGVLGELAEATGAAIAFESPSELAAALDTIASDETARRKLGQRGRVAHRRHFSEEAHLGRYLALIARVARGRGDRGLAEVAQAGVGELAPSEGTGSQGAIA
jgi:glycosyltransferase involved in cell wall biosynthesis